MYIQKCIQCEAQYTPEEIVYTCPKCSGLLEIIYDWSGQSISRKDFDGIPLSLWKYKALLPVEREPVTTNEGGTPLYKCERLGESFGTGTFYVKHEGLNPTGSFKDRGMTVGVSKALELGMKTVACASTGNTSASLAIYGAKAGIPVVVLLPAGKVAMGKVAQAMMHGAKVLSIKGNFDEALKLVRDLCDNEGFYLLNSVNPYRLEGQKTIAFEIVDQMGWEVPDRVVLPVGNAGNITAIYKGFKEFYELGLTDKIPKMTGIQAEGASPVVNAFKQRLNDIVPVSSPETVATAIRIGDPVNAIKALRAIYQSGGLAESVSDEEIKAAQKDLARMEGIGVEPASASSVAGFRKLAGMGIIEPGETVVCVTTGHLLKDPEEVLSICESPIEVEATAESVRKAVFS
ncbi:MAG: threonine synthase [Methanosarcinales archaeon]|nr:threonine synthase [Methanosarcinales archaeon]